ncbi:PTPA-CTERM sorting domain-containing protein [Leptolyngbya sp. NK1-12]|uniref:PTPA-CTERM sorting domain-containing protein n=1 Tax=Leptolyngbya sp. NK1-12 TaxID=2547451 RepID=A0AA97AGD3_9CYAN|nr:PTPA-CTERM sorting domain-containing protein [Leptolyngbya sp. NK1-12]WNZ23309.1 PTPA-CTERM sorting domain-containing protein [Leptolyngbya sp. NK1-12]
MFNLKQISLSAATIAAVFAISAVCTTTAQAAIVTGRISGVWEDASGGVNGLAVGTEFTADYTYDDGSLVTTDVAGGIYTKYLVTSAPLLSLMVNSGAFSHTFDLSGFGNSFSLLDIQGGPAGSEYVRTGFSLYASEGSGQVYNIFSANKSVGQWDNNTPFDGTSARFAIDNNDNPFDGSPIFASTNAFMNGPNPPATAVPTPALLPSLVGLGMAALRRRKEKQGQEAAETAEV